MDEIHRMKVIIKPKLGAIRKDIRKTVGTQTEGDEMATRSSLEACGEPAPVDVESEEEGGIGIPHGLFIVLNATISSCSFGAAHLSRPHPQAPRGCARTGKRGGEGDYTEERKGKKVSQGHRGRGAVAAVRG
jgi:hypothetical protein